MNLRYHTGFYLDNRRCSGACRGIRELMRTRKEQLNCGL